MHMRTEILLVFQTADGLKLHRNKFCGKLGNFIARNKQELLSIVGAVMIDQNSFSKKDRDWGNALYKELESNNIFLIEENMVVNLKGIL